MESNDRVRKNIRALRKYYGETMLDLSIALNVSKSLISDWENGKKQISHNNIEKIAKHYRIPSSIIINDDLSDIDNSFVVNHFLNLKNNKEYRKIMNLSNIFPLFTSKEIKDSKKLSEALEMHKQLYSCESSQIVEVDIEVIINSYEESLSENNYLSVLANFLSIVFWFELIQMYPLDYYESLNKFLSDKTVKQSKKEVNFLISNYLLNDIDKEDAEFTDSKNKDFDEFIMESISKFKNNISYTELGDYYMALRYYFNLVDNSLNSEENMLIGIMILKDLNKLGNRFAKKLLRFFKSIE